jgi:hypothetical protein
VYAFSATFVVPAPPVPRLNSWSVRESVFAPVSVDAGMYATRVT